jgi:hypothetical protein
MSRPQIHTPFLLLKAGTETAHTVAAAAAITTTSVAAAAAVAIATTVTITAAATVSVAATRLKMLAKDPKYTATSHNGRSLHRSSQRAAYRCRATNSTRQQQTHNHKTRGKLTLHRSRHHHRHIRCGHHHGRRDHDRSRRGRRHRNLLARSRRRSDRRRCSQTWFLGSCLLGRPERGPALPKKEKMREKNVVRSRRR